ncbi:MAG: molecular chaperone DnaJ [Myxococcota bacterium]|jgi:molecular chaperone DnaJ
MGSALPDYYAVLGVDRDAGADAIRVAYRALARRFHPDRNLDDPASTGHFKTLTEAYSVLGDTTRRGAYDAGAIPEALTFEPGGSIAEAVGSLVDKLFGVRDERPRDGRNRRYRLTVGFVDAMNGTSQTIELPSDRACGVCDGRGFPPGTIPAICERCGGAGELVTRPFLRAARGACEPCEGRGFVTDATCGGCNGTGSDGATRTLTIAVPAGSDDGQTLRIRGAGERGRHGGRDGDCLVAVTVTPDARLTRDGDDVVCAVPVTVFEAILGAEIPVPTLKGSRGIRLPPGTLDQTVLRMAGFGVLPTHDQRVTVHVVMPNSLAPTEHAQLTALATSAGLVPFLDVARTRPSEDT